MERERTILHTIVQTPLCPILLVSEDGALTYLCLAGQRHVPAQIGEEGYDAAIEEAERWLSVYFSGRDPGFLPPLRLHGTPFERRVWALLSEIPYGVSSTYGALARCLEADTGKRMAAQAVGQAVGRNPVSLIVPCHRILGANGALTGYGGGIERKRALLTLEKIPFAE